ncbi:MAG: T9SS type A sorting domain-containing protein, partial [Ignavibacteriaceae bacterium]|nr:T9SS type A sorting domain-containing protein [Ignavibacteriaceae bacterium]
TSFSISANNGDVILSWSTATEVNNSGFEIQRQNGESEFVSIAFVPGHGTTTESKSYNFIDANLSSGSYTYRLKQIDFNGTFSYSNEVDANVTVPNRFELVQNYPNPFNPSTTIQFALPQSSFVTLKVYNALSQEVCTLVNGFTESGIHSINFDASNLNSGIYFYKLDAGKYSDVRKMTLIK